MLAEDLLLLLTDDETGRHLVDGSSLEYALSGALLVDLATAEKIQVSEPSGVFKRATVTATDTSPVGDPVLDDALNIVAERPRAAQDLIPRLAKDIRPLLLQRLADRGVLRLEEGRILGMFPTTRWPAEDSAHESEVRHGLHQVLVLERPPTPEQASLISLLHAVDRVPQVMTESGIDKRELKRRAKAIADGEFAGAAVSEAIQAVMLVVMTAIIATSATSSSSS